MLGNKLRSWMEAVRPRKKQQRKEKQLKSNVINSNGTIISTSQCVQSAPAFDKEMVDDGNQKSIQTITSQAPRYSGTNLSSPESAYSTGYSTDGTSPIAPPEYYINVRTGSRYFLASNSEPQTHQLPRNAHATVCSNDIVPISNGSATCDYHLPSQEDHYGSPKGLRGVEHAAVTKAQNYDNHNNVSSRTNVAHPNNIQQSNGVASGLTEVVVNSGLTSPRQRNRIRTNPWVPGNNLSPGNSCVGLHMRQDLSKPAVINSPVPVRYLSPTILQSPINRVSGRRESLSSSSSCSSLSAASINWESNLAHQNLRNNSGSDDEEDCTLNEMMGKYDESYVYEKETDILSDSDPTDCEADIDTGQDGGDEDDPLEYELDFIDNGSYLEFNADSKDSRNTGHCTYYNYDSQRRVSRRRVSRRSQKQEIQNQPGLPKHVNEKRRYSNSSKRKVKTTAPTSKLNSQSNNHTQIDGSRSAGATPVSIRRIKHPLFKIVIEERLKRRSNSVSFGSGKANAIDQRDEEADKKYKELIVEAEHILMNMKTNGLSPRRLPGPPNKRVELLRNAESTKPEAFIKNRLIEDTANLNVWRIPSNNFNSPRFSPKRNHITNFINSNSSVLMRRESESSPVSRNELQSYLKASPNSPLAKNTNKNDVVSRRSPKYKKKVNKIDRLKQNNADSFSSDSDDESKRNLKAFEVCCPQSEPVRRKVYKDNCKTVMFNSNYKNICNTGRLEATASSLSLKKKVCFSDVLTMSSPNCQKDENNGSVESLRQQVLLNTIANLKRNLEDQSASLRQVYKSSQNIHKFTAVFLKSYISLNVR